MAYYMGIFLALQDMVERAISAVQLAGIGIVTTDFLGVFMQEFPYPCYTYDE